MADISSIYNQTITSYQKPEDIDFPVSKIRLFIDVLWQAVTSKPLTEDQKVTLKQLIDLLNLLDEHKHETEKELIAAMLPSMSPLLQKMPTLGLTGTHVFAHLVPMYQLYLPSIEQMVKDAHPFTQEETLFYYQATIFDHLFLVHVFEQEANVNMIEVLLTIKALILTNALVYDYHQHVAGRSISFFTFLMRGGITSEQLLPFLEGTVNRIKEETKQTVTNTACLETLEFIISKLMDTTKTTPTTAQTDEASMTENLGTAIQSPQTADAMLNQVTATPVEQPAEVSAAAPTTPGTTETPMVPSVTPEPTPVPSIPTEAPVTPIAPVETPAAAPAAPEPVVPASPTETPTPVSTPEPVAPASDATEVPAMTPATPVETTPPATEAVVSPAPETVAPVEPTPVASAPVAAEPVSPIPAAQPTEAVVPPENKSPLSEDPILAPLQTPTPSA